MRDLAFSYSRLIFSKTNDCIFGKRGIRMNEQVSMTVLVIDDDAHIRTAIGKFLIARGHTVIEAANGVRGVAVVESQAVDIVITDVKMPKMDGFEVLRRVRSVAPETEVIVITGVKEAENAFRALREGAFDFFNKPFKVEELHAAIQRTVRYQMIRKEKDRVQDRLDQFVAQERERSGLNALIGESEAVVRMKVEIHGSYDGADCWGDGYGEGIGCAGTASRGFATDRGEPGSGSRASGCFADGAEE